MKKNGKKGRGLTYRGTDDLGKEDQVMLTDRGVKTSGGLFPVIIALAIIAIVIVMSSSGI